MNGEQPLFAEQQTISCRAQYIADRLELRTLETTSLLATSPLTIKVEASGFAVLFRYGVVVLFNVLPINEATVLDKLQTFMVRKREHPEIEEVSFHIQPELKEIMQGDLLSVRDMSVEKMQLLAEVLSKSVVLSYYEKEVTKHFETIVSFAIPLKEKGFISTRAKPLLHRIGSALLILYNMVGRIEVRDKPELLWEHPELGRFYAHLEDEFEISERHLAVERKLELVSQSSVTLLNALHAKRGLRVEWYIVILIVIEILIILYDIFFH